MGHRHLEQLLDLLACPSCHGALTCEAAGLRCGGCRAEYEVVHGIPDFRPDPPDRPRHGEMCLRLIEQYPHCTYRELWRIYNATEDDALERLWHEHEQRAPERGERRWDEIRRAADAAARPLPSNGVALDVGCGGGSALFAMAKRARLAIGLDIVLGSLLLAKKRLAEAGIDNVALVCGSALEMPLRPETIDIQNATDVVEHVPDQPKLLAESRRVMAPGGAFFLNSPNRYSLLTREPHVKLWGMGFLPRRWMERYVRWRLGKPYQGKRLLSLFELRRLLRASYGRNCAVWSFVPGAGLGNAVARFLGAIGKPFVPEHNVLAWRP